MDGSAVSLPAVPSATSTPPGVLDAADQARLIASNPTEEVGATKFIYKPKQVLTDEQLDKFMETVREDEIWHDLFCTKLTTGLRWGELCALWWEDFDEEHGTLYVRHTFATNALKYGMDVETLSTVIGHTSSRTTLNVYAHVTDKMKQKAAVTIDRGIGKTDRGSEVGDSCRESATKGRNKSRLIKKAIGSEKSQWPIFFASVGKHVVKGSSTVMTMPN